MVRPFVITISLENLLSIPEDLRRIITMTVLHSLLEHNISLTGQESSSNDILFYASGKSGQMKQAAVMISESMAARHQALRIKAVVTEQRVARLKSGPAKPRRIKRFDVWALPLSSGGNGFVQFLHKHPEFGHLLRVFDIRSAGLPSLDAILNSPELFPPVFSLIDAYVVRKHNLQLVGNAPIDFQYPMFRHSPLNIMAPGEHKDWHLWSFPNQLRFVGELSSIERELEELGGWPIEAIARRIEKRIGPKAADRLKFIGWQNA